MRMLRRRLINPVLILVTGLGLTLVAQTPAHAAYWSYCHNNSGLVLCLYDGHLSNGRVSITSQLKNTTSSTVFKINPYTLVAPGDWAVSGRTGYIYPGNVWTINKQLTVTSYTHDVRTGYSNGGYGWVDGIDRNGTW